MVCQVLVDHPIDQPCGIVRLRGLVIDLAMMDVPAAVQADACVEGDGRDFQTSPRDVLQIQFKGLSQLGNRGIDGMIQHYLPGYEWIQDRY